MKEIFGEWRCQVSNAYELISEMNIYIYIYTKETKLKIKINNILMK